MSFIFVTRKKNNANNNLKKWRLTLDIITVQTRKQLLEYRPAHLEKKLPGQALDTSILLMNEIIIQK